MRTALGAWPAALAVVAVLATSCGGDSGSEAGSDAPPGGHAVSHAVAHLQEELTDLGYYEGPHDGVFGEETESALEQLQAEEGLEMSGKLDRATLAVLGALAGKSDALSVKAAQTALAELGLYTGLIDGDYGPATEAAIEEVQREAGIEVDGEFGPETAAALNDLYQDQVLVKKPVGEVGDTTSDQGEGEQVLRPGSKGRPVRKLQKRLTKLGYRPGPVDGAYGAATASAVMAFEKHEGLGRDGIAGPQARSMLRDPRGAGPRSKRPKPRIEVDLDRQIAFLVSRNGEVTILNVSTGSGETYDLPGGGTAVAYTPTGRFTVYREEDGIVEAPLGSLYKPLYFKKGWAVHGAASVPGYPASHGCVRTSDYDQDFVARTLSTGSTVVVYGRSRGEQAQGQPGF